MNFRKENLNHFVVCITAQEACAGLIDSAKDIAKREGKNLEIITVQPKTQEAHARAKAIVALDNLSKSSGLDITIYYSDNAASTVAEHVRNSNAVHVITGLPGKNSKGFAELLSIYLPNIPVTTYTNKFAYTLPMPNEMCFVKA